MYNIIIFRILIYLSFNMLQVKSDQSTHNPYQAPLTDNLAKKQIKLFFLFLK